MRRKKLFCPDCGKPMEFIEWRLPREPMMWACTITGCQIAGLPDGTQFFRPFSAKGAFQVVDESVRAFKNEN